MEKSNFEENYSDPGAGFIAAAGAGFYFWNQMNRPMYEPGHIKDEQYLRNPLSPPAQTNPVNYWTVEPDNQLYHFSEGEGKNVLVIHGGPVQPYSEG